VTPPASPSTVIGLVQTIPAEQIAVIAPEQNIRVTYGALRKQVQAVAELLAAAGVSRGDRIAIALSNGIPAIITFLAASVVGTAAPLDPGYKEDQFRFSLEDTDARVLLVPPEGVAEAREAAGDRIPILTVDMDGAGTVSLRGLTESRPVALPDIEDVALILHTSGNTGRPKRVPLTHANLSISAGNVARHYALGPSDVSLCVMPLFHVHGLVASALATLATGGTVVVPTRFDPLSFWRIARDHHVTWYSAVPTIHQLLLAAVEKGAPKPAGAETLRFIRSCSAALPPQVIHDLEDAFGAPVLEAYGMTEAAHQMASNPLPPAPRLPGSVGRGTDVRISIMDGEGRHLPPGERGEVVIAGANVVRGYENNPQANAASFVAGWFRTGDEGVLNENGYLTLTGRFTRT
jgi:acyl-CoA synthetase (AMP-forming)/AMP-acid ligase II